jgi:hypothetical protein
VVECQFAELLIDRVIVTDSRDLRAFSMSIASRQASSGTAARAFHMLEIRLAPIANAMPCPAAARASSPAK